MEIIYSDKSIIICIKPAGVLSTDEPGGMPELIRAELGNEHANVRSVHRLDRVVSGVMVFARCHRAASDLGKQVMDKSFSKEYLAVVHGVLPEKEGRMTDLLARNKAERKTYVVYEPGKDAQEAILDYKVLQENEGLSLVRIKLQTGRTHQIRAQFSSRGLPLVGDKKYSINEDECDIALWSFRLKFRHPESGEMIDIRKAPPEVYPWTLFKDIEGQINE